MPASLEATPPTDKRFVIRAKVLKGILDQHMDEEENELFPELESKLGQSGIDKLSELVERRCRSSRQKLCPAQRNLVRGARDPSPGHRAARRSGPTKRGKAAQTKRRRARVGA